MTLGESILAAIAAHPGLSALVGDRVFPVDIPVGATLPALAWQLIAQDQNECLAEKSTEEDAFHDVQITAVTDDFDQIECITRELKDALDCVAVFAGHTARIGTVIDLPSQMPGRHARGHDFTF